MESCLIELDNQPGVIPVSIIKIFHCSFTKCVLEVDGSNYKEASGTEQLYGGLEAGIEGGGPLNEAGVVASLAGGGLGVSPN